MRLWDWSLSAYARAGVQALCLDLQDAHGQCVCYLLWAGWAAVERRGVDAEALARASDIARDWDGAVTGPLRAVRRALKTPRPGVAASGQRTLRLHLQAEELTSERLLLDALEPLAPPPGTQPIETGQALRAAMAAWSPAPDDRAQALARTLADAFSAA